MVDMALVNCEPLEYKFLGDNINNSEDSRYSNVGNISEVEILGKVSFIVKADDKKGKVK